MQERYFLILLVAASLAIKVPLALTTGAFGVDESLYLATAREFAETGDFGIRTDFYDFKFVSPLFPLIASAFYSLAGEKAVLLIGPIFSTLTLLVIYHLGRSVLDRKGAVVASLIALTALSMLLLASRPLTESVAIFFFSLGILSLYKIFSHDKSRLYQIMLPVAFVLTFMARFQYGGVLAILFLAYVGYETLGKRNFKFVGPSLLVGIALGAALISPWLFFNYENYGNLLGGPGHQASTDLGFNPEVSWLYFPYVLTIVGFSIPLVLIGLYKSYRSKEFFIFFAFVLIFLSQFFVFGKVAEERYLFPLLPISAVAAALGFASVKRKLGKVPNYILAFILVANAAAGVYAIDVYHDNPRYNDTKEAVMFIEENCTSPVMSNSFTHVWYYADYENVPLRPSAEETLSLARLENVSCIMVSMYEAPFDDPLNQSEEVQKLFESENGQIKIYSLI
jgi:4-amino-4-deoxy-L-arabinose transferase-like glycosyltransferase